VKVEGLLKQSCKFASNGKTVLENQASFAEAIKYAGTLYWVSVAKIL